MWAPASVKFDFSCMRIRRNPIREMTFPYLVKVPNSRTKVSTFGETCIESPACYFFTALKADIITPPTESLLRPLQCEKDDDSSNGNGRREGCGKNIIVL
jgi:hypothetical protein